jgi:hypothetical protein
MGTKIQITITPNTDIMPLDQIDGAMARTIGIIPMRKITLAIECKDEDADDLEDTIDAALSARPVGIEVVLKTTKERHVSRDTALPRVTPMDEAIRRGGIDSVTIESSRGGSATLTTETARNAAAMLHDTPIGSDGPPRR